MVVFRRVAHCCKRRFSILFHIILNMSVNSISAIIQSRVVSFFGGIALCIVWANFSFAHVAAFRGNGDVALLLMIVAEGLAALFFLMRSDPKSVSTNPLDWFLAVVGTFSALLFRPADYVLVEFAYIAMLFGLVMQIFSFLSLNRSFALVAASRSIKTTKMYKLVRHPIYASYCIIFTVYLLGNATLWNLIIYLSVMFFLIFRMFREEKHLAKDDLYREYMSRVRYRIIPFIF